MDYDIKLKEILEIPHVFITVLEYKLQADNHSITRNNFKVQNPTDYFREFVQFIFENLDKPLIIPTDNYIQQTLAQLRDYDFLSDETMNHKVTFEDFLAS